MRDDKITDAEFEVIDQPMMHPRVSYAESWLGRIIHYGFALTGVYVMVMSDNRDARIGGLMAAAFWIGIPRLLNHLNRPTPLSDVVNFAAKVRHRRER